MNRHPFTPAPAPKDARPLPLGSDIDHTARMFGDLVGILVVVWVVLLALVFTTDPQRWMP